MKRSATILLVAVLAVTALLFAQARAGALIGVKGGLTVSDMWGEDSGGADMKTGFLGGAFLTYMFTETFGIQPEILYHRKGIKEDFLGIDITWQLDYLEFPILFKVAIPTESSVSPGFVIGPAFGYNLNSTLKGEFGGESAEEDAGDITSDMDVGVVLGLNVNFDIGSAEILFDLRYTLGMMTIDDEGEMAVRNSAVSFMAGVAFPLGSAE